MSKKTVKKTSTNKGMNLRYRAMIMLLFICMFTAFGVLPLYDRYQKNNRVQQNRQVLAATQTVKPKAEDPLISGKPARIVIPAVGIDLVVADGIYYSQSRTWTLSTDKAHFATITAQPNNKAGNTFIYAHNRKGVFMKLPGVVEGDLAIITAENGSVFTYAFRQSVQTTPNDTSIFSYTGQPRLTLQTCSGLWYQNRQLFQFDLIKVEQ